MTPGLRGISQVGFLQGPLHLCPHRKQSTCCKLRRQAIGYHLLACGKTDVSLQRPVSQNVALDRAPLTRSGTKCLGTVYHLQKALEHGENAGEVIHRVPPYFKDKQSLKRMEQGLPFPVRSCWNGMTAIKAKPFIDQNVRFRSASSPISTVHKSSQDVLTGFPVQPIDLCG